VSRKDRAGGLSFEIKGGQRVGHPGPALGEWGTGNDTALTPHIFAQVTACIN